MARPGGGVEHAFPLLPHSSLQSPWPGIFSLRRCCCSYVWGWCLLNPFSISLSAWIHFHRDLRFPQSSSGSRRSWICLYNSVSLWISDARLVPIIFSTVLRLVTLTEMFWRARAHPFLTPPSLFHTFSFNVFVYYNCCLLFSSFTSYSLAPLYSHPHTFAVCTHFHFVFSFPLLPPCLSHAPPLRSFQTFLSHMISPLTPPPADRAGIHTKTGAGCAISA